MKYKVGDKVILKSGGPHMTVKKVFDSEVYPEDSGYTCVWFSNQELCAKFFYAPMIDLVEA
jgi:uncharacterized protein YodC (DUF2158 family)